MIIRAIEDRLRFITRHYALYTMLAIRTDLDFRTSQYMKAAADQLLLERARRFEKEALAEIFDRYNAGIYRYALRLLGDADMARECMAETFSRFLNALHRQVGPKDYLQAYLYRIAHNWITDHYRSKTPPSLPLDINLEADVDDEPPQVIAVDMELQQMRSALALLTPDQRQVITLKYLEEWENDEIAQALNKPVGAVKSLQHRAIEALRRLLS
jgi:RNA polymerase sigma-70 factor (ECF subfamily)